MRFLGGLLVSCKCCQKYGKFQQIFCGDRSSNAFAKQIIWELKNLPTKFEFRTGQEESRLILQNNTKGSVPYTELSGKANTNATHVAHNLLSTTTCIQIHATIIGALFVIGIFR